MKLLSTIFATLCLLFTVGFAEAQSQSGYKIEVEIEGFEEKEAYLANYFMDKQYIVDTSAVTDGKVIFSGDEPLPEGTYLLVLPPKNDYTQIHIDGDQEFELKAKVFDLSGTMEVRGSKENQLFYDYMHFIAEQRPLADSIRAIRTDSTRSSSEREKAKLEGESIDKRVKAYQDRIKTDHPGTITASILKSLDEVPFPEFTGSEDEIQKQKYLFYKAHYFDNIDLGDPRAIRSTFLAKRVDYYFEKLVVPVPDSLNKEIDYVLGMMKPSPETFKYYVSKFLNDYATSKIVGMDAVYAHLGEKYYMSGVADWSDSTTIAKIGENVSRIKPLLIGKKAPNLTVTGRDGQQLTVHDITSEFTVLFFFDPECGFCKKQTPFVVEFADKFKEKGVSVVSICSKFAPEQDSCWSYVDSKEGMNDAMFNAIDPYHRSKYKVKYDIKSFPQIFVLDRDKTIVSKRISAEQLDEVVTRMIAIREEDNGSEQGKGR